MVQAETQKLANLPHILIVDDDDRIRQLVTRYLEDNGFFVHAAANAGRALELITMLEFDALIVDVMMPGQSGLDLTKDLRTRTDIPVILLTALGEADDRIRGLETGADDYLAKPFEPKELVLRLQAILRRRPPPKLLKEIRSFKVGRWLYDPAHNELQDGKETVRLTTVEDNLLCALAGYAGQTVSREELAELCNLDAGERTIDVQVTRLRRKIEDDPKAPRCLQTVRGKGYLLRIEE